GRKVPVAIKNPFGGEFRVHNMGYFAYHFFVKIPQDACITLATQNWSGLANAQVIAYGSLSRNHRLSFTNTPVSVVDATKVCDCEDNDCALELAFANSRGNLPDNIIRMIESQNALPKPEPEPLPVCPSECVHGCTDSGECVEELK
ncbi:MAG: hypothetical protein ILA52_03155, partial [Alphaproteobacteria bacterium]|nr:hypothetical protein [Alphaproteobacteria bacterium]